MVIELRPASQVVVSLHTICRTPRIKCLASQLVVTRKVAVHTKALSRGQFFILSFAWPAGLNANRPWKDIARL